MTDDNPTIGYDHPTVNPYPDDETPENYETSSALILTHPFERFTADEDQIVEFLEGNNEYDDVFYISQTNGHTPTTLSNYNPPEHMRSRLPPGHEDEHYERGLHETNWGTLNEVEAERLLREYDEIAVGGAIKEDCVTNTLNSLEEVRNSSEEYSSTEVYMEDEITFSAKEDR